MKTITKQREWEWERARKQRTRVKVGNSLPPPPQPSMRMCESLILVCLALTRNFKRFVKYAACFFNLSFTISTESHLSNSLIWVSTSTAFGCVRLRMLSTQNRTTNEAEPTSWYETRMQFLRVFRTLLLDYLLPRWCTKYTSSIDSMRNSTWTISTKASWHFHKLLCIPMDIWICSCSVAVTIEPLRWSFHFHNVQT